MFDDPNLHWKTYGYVDYERLALDATAHNYHVAFATIPLDAWYVHEPTAALFRRHPGRMSLLVHGNNHAHQELHRPSTPQRRRGLAAQAIRRTEELERIAGLQIPRVMAAPHGACSDEMSRELLRVGFEAACISRGSLMSRNPDSRVAFVRRIAPCGVQRRGPAGIPRFGLRAVSDLQARLALFLGQPVVAMGHHGDLRHGLDPLRRVARDLNTMGDVTWMDMAGIAQSNYFRRRTQTGLDVRMYARRIRVSAPHGVTSIMVERPWLETGRSEALIVSQASTAPFSVQGGRWTDVRMASGTDSDHRIDRRRRTGRLRGA